MKSIKLKGIYAQLLLLIGSTTSIGLMVHSIAAAVVNSRSFAGYFANTVVISTGFIVSFLIFIDNDKQLHNAKNLIIMAMYTILLIYVCLSLFVLAIF